MPLKNACFISYRHGQFDLLREFISDFFVALCSEIEPMLGPAAVYLDTARLSGGSLYNQAVAANLYESATMVMIYTPTYFSVEHNYCAREFKAMELLERQRMAAIGRSSAEQQGLIIPVVLRGSKHLPLEIKAVRQYYDFEAFTLGGRRLSRHPKFAPAIREIAGYISDRYNELRSLSDDFFEGPDRFELPNEQEVSPFLDSVAGFKLPFPTREISCEHPRAAK